MTPSALCVLPSSQWACPGAHTLCPAASQVKLVMHSTARRGPRPGLAPWWQACSPGPSQALSPASGFPDS